MFVFDTNIISDLVRDPRGSAATPRGTPVGHNDLWIAAQALSAEAVLVTGNEAEFRRVPGLAVENWLRH